MNDACSDDDDGDIRFWLFVVLKRQENYERTFHVYGSVTFMSKFRASKAGIVFRNSGGLIE